MSAEYKFPKGDRWVLVRKKRDWVSEDVFRFFRHFMWFFPINVILTEKVDDE